MQVTQHGACLGLGLAALGTGNEEIFEDMKSVLYTDSATAGEAAGIALGLLCAGTATEKATELLAYAHDTQHEKARALFIICVSGPLNWGANSLYNQVLLRQNRCFALILFSLVLWPSIDAPQFDVTNLAMWIHHRSSGAWAWAWR